MIYYFYGRVHFSLLLGVLIGPFYFWYAFCVGCGKAVTILKLLMADTPLDNKDLNTHIPLEDICVTTIIETVITCGIILICFPFTVACAFASIGWILFIGWWASIIVVILEEQLCFQVQLGEGGWIISWGVLKIAARVDSNAVWVLSKEEAMCSYVISDPSNILPVPYGLCFPGSIQ